MVLHQLFFAKNCQPLDLGYKFGKVARWFNVFYGRPLIVKHSVLFANKNKVEALRSPRPTHIHFLFLNKQ